MSRLRRFRRVASLTAKALVTLIAIVLALVVAIMGALETSWGKERLRALIVRQANEYLTARLDIGRLEGSLLRGIELGDVRLSRDGQPIVSIETVALDYSPRELWENGTVIRHIRLVRPRFAIARQADQRWNITALVKRDTRQQQASGPGRPIHLQRIEIIDGAVMLADPLQFGAAHVPSRFDGLNMSFAFDYEPVRWRLVFTDTSWTAPAPDLTMTRLHGGLERNSTGWAFDRFFVQTPRTTFTLDGSIRTSASPTVLDLRVDAERFAFQEWAGVLRGLKNIAVDSRFITQLTGPVNRLQTTVDLSGTGGSIKGAFVLDTSVPGWNGRGAVDIGRLDLARWLNRRDRPSDITGRVTFDLALDLGGHFPRGSYAFEGPHAAFMGYEAARVQAIGRLTPTAAQVSRATAAAYGAAVTIDAGSIGLDDPFPYRFQGTMSGLDLRQVPASVPVPHVDSVLAFRYDASGRFSNPFIAGRGEFDRSIFMGAEIGRGTVGTIDTSARPLTFGGEGDIADVNLNRFGAGLDVAWMRDPRYAGTVSGHFRVDGSGTGSATLALTGGGRISRADLFGGRFANADVTIAIADGSLRTTFDGRFGSLDPSIAIGDRQFEASLTGSARLRVGVRDLMLRSPGVADYDIDGGVALVPSTIRGVPVTSASLSGAVHDSTATISRMEVSAPSVEGAGEGTIALTGDRPWDFKYDIRTADLAKLEPVIGAGARGEVSTTGRLTGSWASLRAAGSGTLNRFGAANVEALSSTGTYDVVVPSGRVADADARVDGRSEFLSLFGEPVRDLAGVVTLQHRDLSFDVRATQAEGRTGALVGGVRLTEAGNEADIDRLAVTVGTMTWRVVSTTPPPRASWSAAGFSITPATLVGGAANDERVALSGTWRRDGTGALQVKATHVLLDTLAAAIGGVPRYSGVVDLDATLGGTREQPTISGTIAIVNGRVRNVTYQKLAGRVQYTRRMFDIDFRLDQSAGVWLTAVGKLPYALFDRSVPDADIDVAILSSPIDLGLMEGLTGVVRNVTGQMQVDVRAIGTARDPHFQGQLDVSGAAFAVISTGARYKNGRAALRLATDRVDVNMLHLEDANGKPLEVHGSLGTHELKVGDVEIDATAQGFEALRNQFGRVTLDAKLQVRGRFEQPRVTGDLTVNGDVRVDEILDRVLFQPYATEAAPVTAALDPVVALNPWERMRLDVSVHIPQTLKLVGEEVQITPGTPIGLGNINMRVGGDVFLYKDPGQPLFVNGSLDTLAGTYVFQGRRFDIDETASSINFRGDLNPDLYVSVTRSISGVLTRVTVAGALRSPELRLTSTPPLDASDILSLIVFNTTTNDLSAIQQQELASRAGTLAASFLATPIVSAIESELGLETLQVEPGEFGSGTRVTVGEEIWPGLVARFSQQFGSEPYSEATIEYYLSRLLRLRATFSDAASLNARAPFRRLERAGIDLLVFFSF